MDAGHLVRFHVADPNQRIDNTWIGYGQAAQNTGFIPPPNPYNEYRVITEPDNIIFSTGFADSEFGTPTEFIRVPLDGTEENQNEVARGGGYVSTAAPTSDVRVSLNTNSVDVDITEMLKWYLQNVGGNRMKVLSKGAFDKLNVPFVNPTPYGYDSGTILDPLKPSESYMITQPTGDVDGVSEIVVDPNRRATVEFYSFGETADQYPRFRGSYTFGQMQNTNSYDSLGADGISVTVEPSTQQLTLVLDRSVESVDRFWRLTKSSIIEPNAVQTIAFTTPTLESFGTSTGELVFQDASENNGIVTLTFGSYTPTVTSSNERVISLSFTTFTPQKSFFDIFRAITSPSGQPIAGPLGDALFLEQYQTIDDGTYLYFPQGITLSGNGVPLTINGEGTKRFKIKNAYATGSTLRLELAINWSQNTSSLATNSIPISTGIFRPKLIVRLNNNLTTTTTGGGSNFIDSGESFIGDVATNSDKTLAQVGDPNHIAYRNHTIARWGAPLLSEYNAVAQIPLFAYHISGISRVDFYLNGGPVKTVTNLSYNSAIGATCYNVSINPSEIGDREINELRAIVYPVSGYPQVLQGEIQGGNANIEQVRTNIKYGHHSYFFSTNASGTLRSPVYYVNGQTGLDTNDGLSPSAPKLTIEGALIASGAANTLEPNMVDGTNILLMDNAGATLEYTIGTSGYTGFNTTTSRVNNLKRYVTISPYNNSNVVVTGRGNANGLLINKYRFKNLKFVLSRNLLETVGLAFNYADPNAKTFTNPANGKSYSVDNQYSKQVFFENCYVDCNFQKQFALNGSFDKLKQGYIQEEGELPDGVEITPIRGADESLDSWITRKQVWWYGYSGWTFNPDWAITDDFDNRDYEFTGSATFNSGSMGTLAIVGCTFEHFGSLTKGLGENTTIVLNTNSRYSFEDLYRDAGCIINCSHSDIQGHPLNARRTLTQQIVGLGITGASVTGRAHGDIIQVYPGQGQMRNLLFYGINIIGYETQGPWMNGHTTPFTVDPTDPFTITETSGAEDYETPWNRYGTDVRGWSTIRDIVFDRCNLLKRSDNFNQLFSIGQESPHGNLIIKNTILGNSNSSSGLRRSLGSTPVTTEVAQQRYYGMVRPSLIENSANGSLNESNRKLFFNSQDAQWASAGSPLYWESSPLRSNLPQGKFIYDFRGQLPSAIVVPNVIPDQSGGDAGGGNEGDLSNQGFVAVIQAQGNTSGSWATIRSTGVSTPVEDRITYFGLDSTTGQTTSFGLSFRRQASQEFMRRLADGATSYIQLLGPSAGSTFTSRAGIYVATNINDGLQSSFNNALDQKQWKLDFIAENFNTGWTGYLENTTKGLTYTFTDILTPSSLSENIYFKGSNSVMPFSLGDEVKLTIKYKLSNDIEI